jgi:hypothetical protein
MRISNRLTFLLIVLTFSGALLQGQTSNTGTIAGTVTDATGAVVTQANVELRDINTNIARTTTSSDSGRYAFTNISPGMYKISVNKSGFAQAVASNVKIEVGKAPTLNFKLQVGAAATTVEVRSGVANELQTLDASVGNIIDTNQLANMPTLSRDATALMLLQPMAIPAYNQGGTTGEGNIAGGQVAGARSDQNTFMVDGGDATSNTEATGGYNTSFVATPRAAIPTPVESLEEFRVATNNPSASFSRSSGGEVQMVTRRGTNAWHGAIYEYHQNDDLNANNWRRKHLGQERPESRDNRFGARIGGPIFKDRTFFFVHYEGRHFFVNDDFNRLVPTASMRQGILTFRDASGNPIAYDLRSSTACGGPCDPRGIGISPVIQAIWNTVPLPNDFSLGDGLNTAGFSVPSANIVNEEFGVARFDHKISTGQNFMASYRYSVSDVVPSNNQVDIGGLTPGATFGTPHSTSKRPLQPRYLVTGLTSQIGAHITNDFRFDWLRHWWEWKTAGAHPVVPGTDAAVQISRESRVNGLVPINIDTQQARERTWNGRDYNFRDNVSWLAGNHLIQFGGHLGYERFFHRRDDKVVGGLTEPIYYAVRTGGFSSIGGISVPATVRPVDAGNFRTFYIATLGLIDTASQVLTRAPDLSPNPPLTPITQHTNVNTYDIYFSDTWKLTPTLTFTYGLSWGVQKPPFEENGTQTMMVDAATGKPIITRDYLAARKAAAEQGQVYNPVLAFKPIRDVGRKYPYDPDYTNLGPRLALAWNPHGGKTVIRGGWGRGFDRLNGVGIVMTPALGIGFGDLSVCLAPDISGVCNAGGTPATNFRIGVDGSHINIPTLPPVTGQVVPGLIPGGNPLAPASANSVFENRDFRIDPRRQVGSTDTFDFTVQRELPGNMLLEVGYVGKISRDLYQNMDLNHVPYMMKAGGQTFADAWDAVATQIRSGVDPLTVTPQPWFETMLGPGGTVAAVDPNNFDLGSAFNDGAVADAYYALESSFITGPTTAFNSQIAGMDMSTSTGFANYNAGFVSLRKRMSGGVAFDVNYTYSHALDVIGLNQENTNAVVDSYNIHRQYGPSQFDRRHVVNALATFELPFGTGKRFGTDSAALDRIIGGWSVSGVFLASSGLPLWVYNSNGDFSEFGGNPFNADPAGWVRVGSSETTSSRHDHPTITSSGIGQDSADGNFPNAFADPAAVANAFRAPLFSDKRGGYGTLRGLPRWNFDFAIAKTTKITERVSARFDLQMINAFNHPMLGSNIAYYNGEANTDFGDPANFGVLGLQYNAPRQIQLGIRIDF